MRNLSPFNLRGNVASQLARDSNINVSDNTLWYRGRNDTSSIERSKSPKASDIIRRKYSQGRTVSSNVNQSRILNTYGTATGTVDASVSSPRLNTLLDQHQRGDKT